MRRPLSATASRILIVVVIAEAFFGCATLAGRNDYPDWVARPPVRDDLFVGIGYSESVVGENASYNTAKSAAIVDLVSSIAVRVSSSSTFSQTEAVGTDRGTDSSIVETDARFQTFLTSIIAPRVEATEITAQGGCWVMVTVTKADLVRAEMDASRRMIESVNRRLSNAKNQSDIGANLSLCESMLSEIDELIDAVFVSPTTLLFDVRRNVIEFAKRQIDFVTDNVHLEALDRPYAFPSWARLSFNIADADILTVSTIVEFLRGNEVLSENTVRIMPGLEQKIEYPDTNQLGTYFVELRFDEPTTAAANRLGLNVPIIAMKSFEVRPVRVELVFDIRSNDQSYWHEFSLHPAMDSIERAHSEFALVETDGGSDSRIKVDILETALGRDGQGFYRFKLSAIASISSGAYAYQMTDVIDGGLDEQQALERAILRATDVWNSDEAFVSWVVRNFNL